MARTKLNERQLDVLRRICHGETPITSDDSGLAATVYALRNRGLVTTTRADGRWSAAPTEAGHRHLAQTDATLAPRPSARSTAPEAVELITRLQQSGGTLHIANPTPDERAHWRRALHAARADHLRWAWRRHARRLRNSVRTWCWRPGGYVAVPAGLAARADVLALTDVVVSRSGAGTLAELTALGKAAVFIPLATSAGNEQAYNARHLQEAGAAVALEGEVTAQRMQDALGPLLADARMRQAMAERARAHGRPDAADRLVDVILSAAEGSTAGARKHRVR